jgi:hypothetical protein
MATMTNATADRTLVAIDIAKRSHAVLVETPDGKQRKFRMANSADDYDRLVQLLGSTGCPVMIALEPTGDYHRTLAYRLLTAGFEVCLVSSVAGARFREALFNSWDKNDPKDAGVILALLKQGLIQQYVDPLVAGHHGLQELSKTYYQISMARTRIQHSLLTHYLPLYFPEVECYFHTSHADWFARFLIRFPTAASIRRLDFDTFKREAWDLVGRKVNKTAWVQQIYDSALRSIGLPANDDAIEVEAFRLQLRRY